MSYYFSKTKNVSFEDGVEAFTNELKKERFRILMEIDVKETLKKKSDANFRKYKILGACNQPFAHKALRPEDKIGTMLSCNVAAQEVSEGVDEIAAIDPIASMLAVANPQLVDVANKTQAKLRRVVENC